MAGDMSGIAVSLCHLSRFRTAVVLDPDVQVLLHIREGHHIVARAVGVDDGYRSHIGTGRRSAHGIAADGSEGCDAVGDLVHGVIGEHATHRESRQIDASTVDVVFLHHLVDDGQHEVDVAVAGNVPAFADAFWEDGDELGRIGYRLDVEHTHLVGSVLIHAVTGYQQRTLGTQILGHIDLILPFRSSYFQFLLSRRWQHETCCHRHY